VKVHPLEPAADWQEPSWIDLTPEPQQTTPFEWENNLQFWQHLHELIDTEPHLDEFRILYGELAVLGIERGRAFAPDQRMTEILQAAAQIANAQMRAQSFADRRPDRVVWADRQWQWAALRSEDGDFYATGYLDLAAREKWFFQAIGASPAMFRRTAGAGSLYCSASATPPAPISTARGAVGGKPWGRRLGCPPVRDLARRANLLP
jgi:hypothetical protein